MKRILFIPSTMQGGVYYYRVYTPMKQIIEQTDGEFDITIDNHYHFTDTEKDEIGKNFDIVIIHNGLYMPEIQDEFWKTIVYCKNEYGTRFVLDLDDYWDYGPQHPCYKVCEFYGFEDKMMINFNLFDYVTTTTEYFKDIISKYFSKEKIYVFENAISVTDEQFSMEKNKSDKLRLGLTGGSSHMEDIKQLLDFPKYLTEKQVKEIEVVLCGYDVKNSEKVEIDDNGNVVSKSKLDEKYNWWYQIENKLKLVSPNYKRIETKDIVKGEFGQIYKDIDILLVPLNNTTFNRCKSELKFIEAGFTNTAIMASNVIPYSNFGTNNSDCILVKEPTPQCWAKEIKKLLRDRDKILNITSENSFRVRTLRNLETITDKRIEFLNKI